MLIVKKKLSLKRYESIKHLIKNYIILNPLSSVLFKHRRRVKLRSSVPKIMCVMKIDHLQNNTLLPFRKNNNKKESRNTQPVALIDLICRLNKSIHPRAQMENHKKYKIQKKKSTFVNPIQLFENTCSSKQRNGISWPCILSR